MASSNNQANDWADLPQAKGGEDWQDIPQQQPGVSPDAADAASQGNKPSAQGVSSQPNSPLHQFLQKALNVKSAVQGGILKGFSLNNFDPRSLPGAAGQSFQGAMQEHPVLAGMGQLAGGAGVGALGGMGAAALGPEAASGASLLSKLGAASGRVGLSTGAGALQGYLTKPNDDSGSRAKQAAIGAMISGPISAAGEVIGAVGGRAADWTMKQALGIKRDVSAAEGASINPETGALQQNLRGVGNKLIDMGVRGSKEGMSEQVASKLASEEQNLGELTLQLQGKLSPKDLADAVSQHAKRFTIPSTGSTIPGFEGEINSVRGLSDKYNSMSGLSPQDYLAIKRAGGAAGFTKAGNPGAALDSQIQRSVADAARTKLGTLDPEIINSLGNEQALVLAGKALNKPGTVQGNPLTSMLFSKVPALAGSYGATGLQKSSEAINNPALQQGLFGLGNAATRK
jgi:hypothetical protein